MPNTEYGNRKMFSRDNENLQFILMAEDVYFSRQYTRLNRKEFICQQLKNDGYSIVIGLDVYADQYCFWTPKDDLVSAYICYYPKEANKSLAEIKKSLRKMETEEKQLPQRQTDAYVSKVLDLEAEELGEVEDFLGEGDKENKTEAEFVIEFPPVVYHNTRKLLQEMPEMLMRWMNADELVAFVVNARDWQQLLEIDQKENESKLFKCYRCILEKYDTRGLFLQLLTPVTGWTKIYNKAIGLQIDIPAKKCDEQIEEDHAYMESWIREQSLITYIPSLTAETVEQMLIHQYLIKYPHFSLDFSRLTEIAEEIVYFRTQTERRPEKASQLTLYIAGALKGLSSAHPLIKTEQWLFRRENWNMFMKYIEERPPRYRSWGEIPLEQINKLQKYLLEIFVGEDEQIEMFCQSIKECVKRCKERAEIGGSLECGAPMTLFLAGPTRTGKGEIVRQTVDFLFGSRERLHDKFNGASLKDASSASTIKGAPKGTVGYNDKNPFKEFIQRGTCGILLVDEIHKAHSDVKDLFMQIMEKESGKLQFTTQEVVYFPETVIVFTSNNGCQSNIAVDQIPSYEELKERVMESFCDERNFEPAWRSRIDTFICFNYLDVDAVRKLVYKELEKRDSRFSERNMELEEQEVLEYLTEIGANIRMNGAEQVKKVVNRTLDQAIPMAEASRNPFKKQQLKFYISEGVLKARYQ